MLYHRSDRAIRRPECTVQLCTWPLSGLPCHHQAQLAAVLALPAFPDRHAHSALLCTRLKLCQCPNLAFDAVLQTNPSEGGARATVSAAAV
jgi:hypothetical protein